MIRHPAQQARQQDEGQWFFRIRWAQEGIRTPRLQLQKFTSRSAWNY